MTSIEPRENAGIGIVDDPSWLGSAHGTDATETVTLDVSAFTPEDHYPDGVIPSGTPLAKITATGLYGPYVPADTTPGLGVLVGFLVAPRVVESGVTRIAAANLTHGRVIQANLPDPDSIDADGINDVAGRIRIV